MGGTSWGNSGSGGSMGGGASASGGSAAWSLDEVFGCEAAEKESSCFAAGFSRTAVVPIDASLRNAFLAAKGDRLFVVNGQQFNIYDPTTGSWTLRPITIPAQPGVYGPAGMHALLNIPDGFVAVSREVSSLTWLTKFDEAGNTIEERSLPFTAPDMLVQAGGEDIVVLAQGVRWVPDGAGGMLGTDDVEAPNQLFRFDQALEQIAAVKVPLTPPSTRFLAMSANAQLTAVVDDKAAVTSVSQSGMIDSHAVPQASSWSAAIGVARGEQLLFLSNEGLLVFDPAGPSLSLLRVNLDPSLGYYFPRRFSVAIAGCHAAVGSVGERGEGVAMGSLTLLSGDFETRQHFAPELDYPHVVQVAVSEQVAGALFFGHLHDTAAELQVFECAE